MPVKFTSYIFRVAAFFGSCFFIVACENDIREVDKHFRKKAAIEEAFGVESYMSQEGKVKAKLTAPYMIRNLADSAYLEFPRTLHVDFFNDTLAIESTLDALYARHLETEGKVLLRDSVVVINKFKGDTLRTSELWWDRNKQEFYTDKPVRIFQRVGYTFGKFGMRAKQDFSEWWILGSSGERDVPKDAEPIN
jgi:LPS export ABC transporter protein LptC